MLRKLPEEAERSTQQRKDDAAKKKDDAAASKAQQLAAFVACEFKCMCGLTPCPYAKWYRCPACGPKSAKCRVRACVEARKGAGPSAAATPQQPEEMSSSHESDSEYCNLYHYMY